MADVTVKYKGSTIAELSESGKKTMKTAGTYCEGDIEVSYTAKEVPQVRSKVFEVNIPTAVAAQYVTLVTGDPDVAAHYADDSAMVTIKKMTNNTSNGASVISHGNHQCGNATWGSYINFNGTSNAAATIGVALNSTTAYTSTPHARADANGNIKAYAVRQQNNFGGANYLVIFSW